MEAKDLNGLESARNALFVQSEQGQALESEIKGYGWNDGRVDYQKLLQSYASTGLQASNFGAAVTEINKMISKRNEPLDEDKTDDFETDAFAKRRSNCTLFLGYTSNMVSCGIRETLTFLAKHRMIDCIVTSAGGIEEDFVKCLAPTYLGDFGLDGRTLRSQGINRIGNMLVPNDNYCKFEDWVMPVLDKMFEEQNSEKIVWTPSTIIERLGREINDESSVYYWCAKNQIPVFCPALTDGSLGDMMFFHSYNKPGLVVDILGDLRRLNRIAMKATHTGMIILGGGVMKHHICNANLMRNGADFSVFVNTGADYDGSDSGAKPDEAISWGKIKTTATPVKIYADASLVFPLLVAETFAKDHYSKIGK